MATLRILLLASETLQPSNRAAKPSPIDALRDVELMRVDLDELTVLLRPDPCDDSSEPVRRPFDVAILPLVGTPETATRSQVEAIRTAVGLLGAVPLVVLGDELSFLETARNAGAEQFVLADASAGVALECAVRNAVVANQRRDDDDEDSARLRELIRKHSSARLVLDLQGRVKFANEASATLLGQPADALLDQSFSLPAADCDSIELDVVREIDNHAETIAVRMYVEPLDWFGRRAYVASLYDVTDRDEQVREARDAVRLRDQFLATLSHELRNPLAALSSAAHLLVQEGIDDELIREAAAIVKRQCGVASSLLDDLLDISRIWRGKIQLACEPLQFDALIGEVVSSLRTQLDDQQRSVSMTLPSEPLYCRADHGRMKQVLMNLLTNAIKYTQADGTITIDLQREGDCAVLSVCDDGAGIESEMLTAIFEPFVQARQTLNRADGGMGIGLALVRKIIELHGGSVTATSAGPGRGAEFAVILPALEAMPTTSNGGSSRRSAALDVVLVEDEPDIRAMMTKLLELIGHQVTAAADGREGIDVIKRSAPDVALIDIGMPYCSGYDVARAIRAEPSTANIKLVAVTGFGQTHDRHRAFAAGFDEHLTKPVDLDVLEATLQGVM